MIGDQLNRGTRTPFNLVYIYCLLTLLSLNITRCSGLVVGSVDLHTFFRPSVVVRSFPHPQKTDNNLFVPSVLSIALKLLYGSLPEGFYPEKAAINRSKITLQVRCACLSLWERCFPLFFMSNSMFDTMEVVLELEKERIRAGKYSFWLNLFGNRIARFISLSLGELLFYDEKEIIQYRGDAEDELMDPDVPFSGFTNHRHVRRCLYVGFVVCFQVDGEDSHEGGFHSPKQRGDCVRGGRGGG